MSDLSAFADMMDEPERDEPWPIDDKDKDPRSEFERQSSLLKIARKVCPGVDFVAIPNAGKSSDWERLQRWREGARAGALDLIATWKTRGVAFIEMKDGQKMPTPAQRDRLNMLYRQGHHCGVFRREWSVLDYLRSCGAPFIDRRAL